LDRAGFDLVKRGEREYIKSFLPFQQTLAAARKAGVSLGDYIDAKHQLPGATQATIDQLVARGVLHGSLQGVCEIGPGSGRYLEKVLPFCTPASYEIYETEKQWSDWLAQTYAVKAHEADGVSLRGTPSGSAALVHAHKVFVYVPFLVTCRYLKEMCRVARKGGWIVFDIVSESCMPEAAIEKWFTSGIFYPCIVPRQFVIDFLHRRQCHLQSSFLAPLKPAESEYLIFRKAEG
jgi:hypothetical protein